MCLEKLTFLCDVLVIKCEVLFARLVELDGLFDFFVLVCLALLPFLSGSSTRESVATTGSDVLLLTRGNSVLGSHVSCCAGDISRGTVFLESKQ